jgi:hypothetical protein
MAIVIHPFFSQHIFSQHCNDSNRIDENGYHMLCPDMIDFESVKINIHTNVLPTQSDSTLCYKFRFYHTYTYFVSDTATVRKQQFANKILNKLIKGDVSVNNLIYKGPLKIAVPYKHIGPGTSYTFYNIHTLRFENGLLMQKTISENVNIHGKRVVRPQ